MSGLPFTFYIGQSRTVRCRLVLGSSGADVASATTQLNITREGTPLTGSPFTGTPDPDQTGDNRGMVSFNVTVPNDANLEGIWKVNLTLNGQTWHEHSHFVTIEKP